MARCDGKANRDREISDAIIIVRVKTTSGRRRSEILSEYSVEQIDEKAMTEFIQSSQCRRVILAQYMDIATGSDDCRSINGVFCDWCKANARVKDIPRAKNQEEKTESLQAVMGSQGIASKLKSIVSEDELLFQTMNQFQVHCLYCILVISGSATSIHQYQECTVGQEKQCGYEGYEDWRRTVDFGEYKYCWKCGLSQELCRG